MAGRGSPFQPLPSPTLPSIQLGGNDRKELFPRLPPQSSRTHLIFHTFDLFLFRRTGDKKAGHLGSRSMFVTDRCETFWAGGGVGGIRPQIRFRCRLRSPVSKPLMVGRSPLAINSGNVTPSFEITNTFIYPLIRHLSCFFNVGYEIHHIANLPQMVGHSPHSLNPQLQTRVCRRSVPGLAPMTTPPTYQEVITLAPVYRACEPGSRSRVSQSMHNARPKKNVGILPRRVTGCCSIV